MVRCFVLNIPKALFQPLEFNLRTVDLCWGFILFKIKRVSVSESRIWGSKGSPGSHNYLLLPTIMLIGKKIEIWKWGEWSRQKGALVCFGLASSRMACLLHLLSRFDYLSITLLHRRVFHGPEQPSSLLSINLAL